MGEKNVFRHFSALKSNCKVSASGMPNEVAFKYVHKKELGF